MSKSNDIISLYNEYLMPTYKPAMVVSSGTGCKVRKFAVVSDVPGLLRDPSDPKTLLPTLHLSSVAKLKAEGIISGGMLPKIEGCEDAIRAGVKKVHLVDGRMPQSLLLEIFTREGVGTEITDEH